MCRTGLPCLDCLHFENLSGSALTHHSDFAEYESCKLAVTPCRARMAPLVLNAAICGPLTRSPADFALLTPVITVMRTAVWLSACGLYRCFSTWHKSVLAPNPELRAGPVNCEVSLFHRAHVWLFDIRGSTYYEHCQNLVHASVRISNKGDDKASNDQSRNFSVQWAFSKIMTMFVNRATPDIE